MQNISVLSDMSKNMIILWNDNKFGAKDPSLGMQYSVCSVQYQVLQLATVCCTVCCCVCCSVWQFVAACLAWHEILSRLPTISDIAVCCSVLQRVAACCSVLQRVAACVSHRKQCWEGSPHDEELQRVAVCCSACCSVLEFVPLGKQY